ncbi:hypothetical protein F5Y13DRAFT_198358 [Hypoxylon sp. FL1857]|nr:hypothetical protein F5Y13DRAFT_198358 [Hypoxylon sp. FL1857]
MTDSRSFVGGNDGVGSGSAQQTGHVEIKGGRGRGGGGGSQRGGSGGGLGMTQGPGGSVVPIGQGESGIVGGVGSSGKVNLEVQARLPSGLTLLPGSAIWDDYEQFHNPVVLQDRYNPQNRGSATYRSGQLEFQADINFIADNEAGRVFIEHERLIEGVDEVHVTYTKASQRRLLKQLSRPVEKVRGMGLPLLPSARPTQPTQQPPPARGDDMSVDEEFRMADRVNRRHTPYGRSGSGHRGRGRGYRGGYRGGWGGRGGRSGNRGGGAGARGGRGGVASSTPAASRDDAKAQLDASLDEYFARGHQDLNPVDGMNLDYEEEEEPHMII